MFGCSRIGASVMGFFLLILFMIAALAVVVVVQIASAPKQRGKAALAAADEFKVQYNVKHAIVDPDGGVVGLRPDQQLIVLKTKAGTLHEIKYRDLRGVTLTPVSSTYSETSGETNARRGSQLIGAGIGAAVAGPLGGLIGGLSAPQTQSSSTATLTSVSDLELELFLRNEELPRFEIHAGTKVGDARLMVPEMSERFKDMGARLANIVDGFQR
jgi:hypothetical protein